MISRTAFALPAIPVPSLGLRRLYATYCAMRRTRQLRRILAEMDDRTLADIGATRAFAQLESARPFFDLER